MVKAPGWRWRRWISSSTPAACPQIPRCWRRTNAEQVAHAFEILLSDKSVKAVLINVWRHPARGYAGDGRRGSRRANIQLPVVLRLEAGQDSPYPGRVKRGAVEYPSPGTAEYPAGVDKYPRRVYRTRYSTAISIGASCGNRQRGISLYRHAQTPIPGQART